VPLDSPPRDEGGEVLPHDHSGIEEAWLIIRRVSEQQIVIDKNGVRRLSSLAFKASKGDGSGMSIDLYDLIVEAGLEPKEYLTTPRWFGSVYFTAGALRNAKSKVGYDPLPDNPYHGEVWGAFDRSHRDGIRSLAKWFVEIPDTGI